MEVVPEGGSLLYYNETHDPRRPHGRRALAAGSDALQRRVTLFARSKSGYTPTLIVDYGGLSGENYWYQHSNVWENEHLLTLHAARGASTRGRGAGRWRRTTISITSSSRRGAKQVLDAGGVSPARRARPVAGPRRALGAVDASAGRHDEAGSHPVRYDQRCARAGPRRRDRLARDRASSRTSSFSIATRSRTSAIRSRSPWSC